MRYAAPSSSSANGSPMGGNSGSLSAANRIFIASSGEASMLTGSSMSRFGGIKVKGTPVRGFDPRWYVFRRVQVGPSRDHRLRGESWVGRVRRQTQGLHKAQVFLREAPEVASQDTVRSQLLAERTR